MSGPANKCCSCHKTSCKGNLHSKCLIDKFNGRGESYYCKNCDTRSIPEENDDLISDANLQTYNKLKEVLKSRGLNVFHQNFNGLYFKIDKLRILLQETLKDIHIFGITQNPSQWINRR